MKKIVTSLLTVILLCAALVFTPACKKDLKKEYAKAIAQEMRGCFDFFWNEAQTDESKPTYGLIVDRAPAPTQRDNASVASVGFGLTAYVIGVEEGYVSKAEAETRTLKTLETMLDIQSHDDVAWNGFFAHFINMNTGERYGGCEISSVDTALLLCGALTAGKYFGGEVENKANELYSNVNWNSFIINKNGKSYISMAYNPERQEVSSVIWDWYAEQLMIYVLGAGSPKAEYRLDDKTYYDFARNKGSYGDSGEFIYSYFGSIFTYQFSHAWVNFKGLKDKNGTDWFENSVMASKADYEYCKDKSSTSETFEKGGWGLTACDAPNGYSGDLGTPPRGWNPNSSYYNIESTVAPCGAIGSVVFTPEQSLKALAYYQTLDRLNGNYGLRDAYNLDKGFYASDYIGIDKGISIIMLSNYKSGKVWDLFMDIDYIGSGLEVLGFTAA